MQIGLSIAMRKPGGFTLTQRAQAILRSFGTDASSYPFATRQGLFQDSAGTVPAVVATDPIGKATDAIGTNHATQTTAGNRPLLAQDGNGRFYASFDGSNDSLALASVPFQMADDHFAVCCCTLGSTTVGTVVFSPAYGTTSTLAMMRVDTTVGVEIKYITDASIHYTISLGAVANGETIVIGVRCTAGVVTAWKNLVSGGTITPAGVFTLTGGDIGTNNNYVRWQGRIYEADCAKGTLSDAQMAVLMKAAAQRAGLVI